MLQASQKVKNVRLSYPHDLEIDIREVVITTCDLLANNILSILTGMATLKDQKKQEDKIKYSQRSCLKSKEQPSRLSGTQHLIVLQLGSHGVALRPDSTFNRSQLDRLYTVHFSSPFIL